MNGKPREPAGARATANGIVEHEPSSRLNKVTQDGWSIVAQAVASCDTPPVALHLGSFGFGTPDFVREHAKRALDRPECNQYSPCNGRKTLRDALAKTYTPFLRTDINPDTNVVVTTGAIEGILSAVAAFISPGDEVLMFDAGYDQFPNNVQYVGGTFRLVPIHFRPSPGNLRLSSADWKIDVADLEAARTSKTKMLIMNTPQNPLGKVFTKDELTSIGEWCVKHNILILSDEVYEHMSYVPFTRVASISPETANITLTVGSAGKIFFLTGWRVGWVIGPEHLIKHVTKAHIAMCFSTVSPFQEAIADALLDPQCAGFFKKSNSDMHQRMNSFNEIWDELDFKYYEPEGGYFVVVDMTPLQVPEELRAPPGLGRLPKDCHLAWFLTTVIGVSALPCSTFTTGDSKIIPEGAVRFSFGKSLADLELAKTRLRRLKEYL